MNLLAVTNIVNNATTTTTTSTSALIPADDLWMVISGFIVAFVLAFGIGANDVANSFATSVGAKVLTLFQACVLASVFETAGAILIGGKVSDTIRKGIIDVTIFTGEEKMLLIGNIAALSGACVWLLVATFFKMPVSGTHSIVGATLGYALVAFGGRGIQWIQLILIVGSWVISPLLAGLVSTALFAMIRRFILNKDDPLEPGLVFLPFIYALTVMINVFSIFYSKTTTLGFDKIPLLGCFLLTFGAGLIVAILVRLVVVPRMRVKIFEQCDIDVTVRMSQEDMQNEGTPILLKKAKHENILVTEVATNFDKLDQKYHTVDEGRGVESTDKPNDRSFHQVEFKSHLYGSIDNASVDQEKPKERLKPALQDRTEASILFTFLQILTAIFGAFAHGGNDVSNAIGPLVSIWSVSTEGSVAQESGTPLWLLSYGGVGICFGLWVLGRRVIETLGEDLTKVTPSSGFCIEIGSAFTVLIASNIGIPISSTHCKVGAVVCTGRFRSRENVDWRVFRNIVFAWIVTLPVSGLISAAIFAGLRELLKVLS